jgi:DNA-binding CsgD family transcriptional regulator
MSNKPGEEFLEALTPREIDVLSHVAEGSSDSEIAQELFLSLNTIKWHNRQIYGKLGVANRRQAVKVASQAGLLDAGSAKKDDSATDIRHNLPSRLTSFIGREDEIVDIKNLLEDVRLLTLTGPGGVGKTRLALQAAETLVEADEFADGIYFVDLSPLEESSLVASALANVFSLPEVVDKAITDVLKTFLKNKQMLFLVDNFEHVVEAAPLLSDLLQAAPGIKILVTSRESLQISGEHIYVVPSLDLKSSMTLFQQRAKAIKRGISFDQSSLAVVERISTHIWRVYL